MKFSSSLKLNHVFRRLYHTSGFADGYLVLYARKNRTEGNRVGITVSKKLGKAHIRNRTRRRIREIYRLNEDRFQPGWDIVVVARSKAVDASFDKLTKSYLSLAKKANILAPVIANQSADWCGDRRECLWCNPPVSRDRQDIPGDSHATAPAGAFRAQLPQGGGS